MVSFAGELGHCDPSVEIWVKRGRGNGGPPRCCGIDFAGLCVVAEEALGGDYAVLVGHLDGKIGAWVDGGGLAISVGDFVHVDFVEDDFDAHPAFVLGVVDEDEFASFAFWELAEKVVVGWALGVHVVVHCGGDGWVPG